VAARATKLRSAAGAALLAALAACSDRSAEAGGFPSASVDLSPAADSEDEFGAVGDFAFTAQDGRTVARADLLGHPWVLASFFTTCTGPCPGITAALAGLQGELEGTAVKLVSLTVNPSYDSSEVLARYAADRGADPARWIFVTGDEPEIYRLLVSSFHLAAMQDPQAGQPSHDARLVAVDAEGRVRGYYSSTDPAELALLAERMRFLDRAAVDGD
jgi:protein SCO1/2